jgi:hypothetical protein
METKDARFWDKWWRDRLSEATPDVDMFPDFTRFRLSDRNERHD